MENNSIQPSDNQEMGSIQNPNMPPTQSPYGPAPTVGLQQQNNLQAKPDKTNFFAILGIIFAFFMPILGLIFSIVGLIQIRKKKESGKILAIIGVVVSTLNIIVLSLIATLAFSVFTVFSDVISVENPASAEFNSVYSTLVDQESWDKVCDNGAGKGIDNTTPWAMYLYKTNSSKNIEDLVVTNGEAKGYSLVNDREMTKSLEDIDGYANSIYLKDADNKNGHDVRIALEGDIVAPDCTLNGVYMPEIKVEPGQKLIEIHFTLN